MSRLKNKIAQVKMKKQAEVNPEDQKKIQEIHDLQERVFNGDDMGLGKWYQTMFGKTGAPGGNDSPMYSMIKKIAPELEGEYNAASDSFLNGLNPIMDVLSKLQQKINQ
jgi:hypothetical protein